MIANVSYSPLKSMVKSSTKYDIYLNVINLKIIFRIGKKPEDLQSNVVLLSEVNKIKFHSKNAMTQTIILCILQRKNSFQFFP